MNSIHHNFDKKGKWIEKEFYQYDEASVAKYISSIELLLKSKDVTTIEEFNRIIETTATQTLKRTYKRRVITEDMKTEVIEAPWMTKAIRTEIKKRKTLNREK